jgi:curved DNA-binding protein CbpA
MADLNIDWSKLSQPILFFGLPQDFELADLKKSYKSYIKLYKPDLHPEEFKKIRKAYEELLEEIDLERYDEIQPKAIDENIVKINVNDVTKSNQEDYTFVNAFEQKKTSDFNSISAVEDSLKAMPLNSKTCLYWASFSDIKTTERNHFYWLVKGAQYLQPREYSYAAFIYQYLKSTNAQENWLDILLELSPQIKVEIFYSFLAPIFNKLIKEINAEKVIQCLFLCEKKIIYTGDYLEHKQELYLIILGRGVLTEKPEIFGPIVDCVQNYKSRLSDEQYNLFEFYLNLIDYTKERKKINFTHELNQKFDELITNYVSADEEKCRKLILDIKLYFKMNLTFDLQFVNEEFNLFSVPLHKVLVFIFDDLSHILSYQELSDKMKIKQADMFNDLISKTYNRSIKYVFYKPVLANFAQSSIILLAMLIIPLLELFNIFRLNLWPIPIFYITILAGYFLTKKKINIYLANILDKFDYQIYHKKIQKKIFYLIFKKELSLANISLLPDIYKDQNKIINAKIVYQRLIKEKIYFIHELFIRIK